MLTFFPFVSIPDTKLLESNALLIVRLTFSNYMNENDYIVLVAKSAAMRVGSLGRARHIFVPECILEIYKIIIYLCLQ